MPALSRFACLSDRRAQMSMHVHVLLRYSCDIHEFMRPASFLKAIIDRDVVLHNDSSRENKVNFDQSNS